MQGRRDPESTAFSGETVRAPDLEQKPGAIRTG